MKETKPWKTYLFWIVLTEGAGALAGLLSRQATEIYETTVKKPPLSPPGVLFPIVWSVLYLLMALGAAAADLAPKGQTRTGTLRLFALQLAFNFAWPLFFFNLRAFGFSFFWLLALWALVLLFTLSLKKLRPKFALLQLPYLLWVAFAAYLNAGVWLLNR